MGTGGSLPKLQHFADETVICTRPSTFAVSTLAFSNSTGLVEGLINVV
jgi:hypothetical protein